MKKHNFDTYLAECIGTMIFVMLGGLAASLYSNIYTVSIIHVIGLCTAIITLGTICPGHFNPAITIHQYLQNNL